jgi:hypothetical protein
MAFNNIEISWKEERKQICNTHRKDPFPVNENQMIEIDKFIIIYFSLALQPSAGYGLFVHVVS